MINLSNFCSRRDILAFWSGFKPIAPGAPWGGCPCCLNLFTINSETGMITFNENTLPNHLNSDTKTFFLYVTCVDNNGEGNGVDVKINIITVQVEKTTIQITTTQKPSSTEYRYEIIKF